MGKLIKPMVEACETVPGCIVCGKPTDYRAMIDVCRRGCDPAVELHDVWRQLEEAQAEIKKLTERLRALDPVSS